MDFLSSVASGLVVAVIVAAFGIGRTQRIEVSGKRRIGWFWKALVLVGGFMFWYGMLLTVANGMTNGIEAYNTRLGVALWSWGFLFWLTARFVIYFKRD